MSDWLLFNANSAISWREQYNTTQLLIKIVWVVSLGGKSAFQPHHTFFFSGIALILQQNYFKIKCFGKKKLFNNTLLKLYLAHIYINKDKWSEMSEIIHPIFLTITIKYIFFLKIFPSLTITKIIDCHIVRGDFGKKIK